MGLFDIAVIKALKEGFSKSEKSETRGKIKDDDLMGAVELMFNEIRGNIKYSPNIGQIVHVENSYTVGAPGGPYCVMKINGRRARVKANVTFEYLKDEEEY